jgi:L-aminopeptidase/D-esterase-like protein
VRGTKGGLGTASLSLGDVRIGALAVVNAAGDVVDWRTGRIVAGARRADGGGFADTVATLKRTLGSGKPHGGSTSTIPSCAARRSSSWQPTSHTRSWS